MKGETNRGQGSGARAASPQHYEDLEVFQESHRLALEIYGVVRSFPATERFRLTDQLCRAASSVPANIAESFGRHTRPDTIRFLLIARGSLEETRYFLLLARDLGYVPAEKAAHLRERYVGVRRMLNGLISYQRRAMKSTP
ncbi:MAG: four helix bundle protein [Chloroflexia bacterium]